ncbi:hypothetical protein M9H77_26258 [Catharanthus roseus]|uniref:Uncharacterized protein n=1 Tax=Catharanthus roseus TaxID=4058 RepID=A0ACC0AAR3_CATRO|nr:hypothetical protein M9H77_26258 [Catharanthus roseus]
MPPSPCTTLTLTLQLHSPSPAHLSLLDSLPSLIFFNSSTATAAAAVADAVYLSCFSLLSHSQSLTFKLLLHLLRNVSSYRRCLFATSVSVPLSTPFLPSPDRKKIEKCHTGMGIPRPYPGPWRVRSGSRNFIPGGYESGSGSKFRYKSMDLGLGVH